MPLGQRAEAAVSSPRPDPHKRRDPARGEDGTVGSPPAGGAAADLALVRAFQSGDASAFDRLYLRHQDYVYNICLGLLSNPEDARDCAQETFLRVFRKVGEFRAQAAFSTWLYRVAVNVCVGHLRQRPKVALCSLDAEAETGELCAREVAAEGPALDAGLERAVDEARVRAVVATLPEDYRVVLVLRYFQNLSYEEMREVLGYSLAQVKVKLHRARRAFARQWAATDLESVRLG
jgi:RNA polymerase sigma-70 factor (ECF subfamily)